MKKTWLRSFLIPLLLAVVLSLGACGSGKLAEGFDEAALKTAAESTIALVNAGDADALRESGTEQLATALTDEVMAQVFADIHSAGNFEKIEEMSVTGVKSQDGQQDYAVVVAKAKYATRSFIYTLSYDVDMKLGGLYYK